MATARRTSEDGEPDAFAQGISKMPKSAWGGNKAATTTTTHTSIPSPASSAGTKKPFFLFGSLADPSAIKEGAGLKEAPRFQRASVHDFVQKEQTTRDKQKLQVLSSEESEGRRDAIEGQVVYLTADEGKRLEKHLRENYEPHSAHIEVEGTDWVQGEAFVGHVSRRFFNSGVVESLERLVGFVR